MKTGLSNNETKKESAFNASLITMATVSARFISGDEKSSWKHLFKEFLQPFISIHIINLLRKPYS